MTAVGTRSARPVLLALLLGIAALVVVLAGSATPARAADLSEFDPGNIITDQVFFDEGSMSPQAIQAFLDAKGAACVRGTDGSPCLADYRQDTTTRAASSACPQATRGPGRRRPPPSSTRWPRPAGSTRRCCW